MAGPPGDPIASAAEGATRGALSFFAEGAKKFLDRVLHREIVGLDRPEDVEVVKEQRRTPEWTLFSRYIRDRDLRVQVQLGLALKRAHRPVRDETKIARLRSSLIRQFGEKGLHVAEFTCLGGMSSLLRYLMDKYGSEADVAAKLEDFCHHIDSAVLFIQAGKDLSQQVERARRRIEGTLGGAVLLVARGAATTKLSSVLKQLERDPAGYRFSVVEQRGIDKETTMVAVVDPESGWEEPLA